MLFVKSISHLLRLSFAFLGTVGNVTSIFLGFSIVAAFEIGFFTSKYIILAIKSAIRQNDEENKKGKKEDDMQLYICP